MQYRRGLLGGSFLLFGSVVALGAPGGCAGGNELGNGGHDLGGSSPSSSPAGTGGSTSSSSSSSSSSSAGVGGSGGVGGLGGAGGSGGATGGGGAGGSTSSSGGSGGGTQVHHVVVLGAGASGSLGAAFDDQSSTWTPTTLGDASNDAVGLAFDGHGLACGVVRAPSDGAVRFVLWNDAGSGAWGAFAPLSTDTTRAGAAMTGGAGLIDLVFQGTDFKHYLALRDTSWSVAAESVSFSGSASFGPSPAATTRLGADLVIAYAGDNHDLYDETRTGGSWGQAAGHALGNNGIVVSPAITTLAPGGGADLMIVFVRADAGNQIHFTKRTNGSWSAPLAVDVNALSNDPPAIATLANGDVALVFRGQDGRGYFSRWTGTPVRSWTAPAPIATNVIPSTPAIAPGSTADGEIAFVDGTTGAASHVRLNGTGVGSATTIGGSSLTHVAIASQ